MHSSSVGFLLAFVRYISTDFFHAATLFCEMCSLRIVFGCLMADGEHQYDTIRATHTHDNIYLHAP